MTTIEQLSVIHSTFVLERSYSTAPERVFAAFADPAKKRRWFIEGGNNEVQEFEMDFRVGGNERARILYKEGTPIQGMTITNETRYQDIVPERRIVAAYSMTLGDRRMSASLVTVELTPTESGTDLILTHQGAYFEGADGPQMREQGWRTLLERLAKELTR
jgi:uncharacterized protein YndB with AHSA1/START domain